MSVLIKGIEMPKRQILAVINPNGLVEVLDGNTLIAEFEAVPVPPHGRLIDAIWVRDHLIKQWIDYSDDSYMYKRGMEDAYEVIRHAPTIIPVEEGGE